MIHQFSTFPSNSESFDLTPIPQKHRVILAPNSTVPELQGKIPTPETFYQVAPLHALEIHGPVCTAIIQPSQERQSVLSEYDIPVKTTSGLVIFDTGAGMSCIDESAATEMLLPIVGTGRAIGVNSERGNVPVCSAQLILTTHDEKRFILPISQAFALPLENRKLLAIIGRDIMKFGDLVYEGFFGRAFFDFTTHVFPQNE